MKTKTTLLLLSFFLLVGSIYSQTDEDPDKLGGPVLIGEVAPFRLVNNTNAKMLKSGALTSRTATTLALIPWDNPGLRKF
jgi:hypothetical protein